MKFMKKTVEREQRTANIRQGGRREYFTQIERQMQKEHIYRTKQPFELEVSYTAVTITTEIRINREYLEQKMGLKELLRIIQKLSKEKGALSKQLYKYYNKMGTSKMSTDVWPMYNPGEKIDISNPEDRKAYYTLARFHYGKTTHTAFGKYLEDALGYIAEKHLSRCLAILNEKGYITSTNTKKNVGMKRWTYTYSNTYYKLTEKAEKLLGAVKA